MYDVTSKLYEIMDLLEARNFDVPSRNETHKDFILSITEILWDIRSQVMDTEESLVASESMVKTLQIIARDEYKENALLRLQMKKTEAC